MPWLAPLALAVLLVAVGIWRLVGAHGERMAIVIGVMMLVLAAAVGFTAFVMWNMCQQARC